MAQLQLTGVAKSFGNTPVLEDVNLEIADGEFVVFIGPSGCGKSTLLRVIAGLEEMSGGELSIGDRVVNDASPAERGVAMVFQSYALYPHMTVYENMAFALKLAKAPRAEIDAAVRNAARILNIEHLLKRLPKSLSGGQRQRVAIGRAIVRKPEVFLFDEPLSNLDTALRVKMRYEFARLREALKTTMIYVTHDQVEAMTLADRIVVLSAGRVEQVGSPSELYQHPQNLFVAGFIGSPHMNFLAGEVVEAGASSAVVRLGSGETIRADVDASQARLGDPVTVGVRPEHLTAGEDVNAVTGKVRFVEHLGSVVFAYASLTGSDEELTVQLPADAAARAGDDLRLSVPSREVHLFDGAGRAFTRTAAPGPGRLD